MCVYMALTASNFLFLSCAGAESWRSCEQTSLQEDLKRPFFKRPLLSLAHMDAPDQSHASETTS